MPKPIRATPTFDALAVSWAERSRRLYQCGQMTAAVDAARKAVAAHDAFGSRKVAEPQIVAACRVLLKRYES